MSAAWHKPRAGKRAAYGVGVILSTGEARENAALGTGRPGLVPVFGLQLIALAVEAFEQGADGGMVDRLALLVLD